MSLNSAEDFVIADRNDIESWVGDNGERALDKFLDSVGVAVDEIHIFAAVTNPAASATVVEAINLMMPKMVLDRATNRGFRVTTYGSALESLGPTKNAYLESKRRLAELVTEFARNGTDAFHIRFHTVYGAGFPQEHMFLGQIFSALVASRPFNMTSGEQLREYQHVDDVVAAISKLNQRRHGTSATISHGMPVRLRDLATAIFTHFDRADMLNIGTLDSEEIDVYQLLASQTLELDGINFREPISGVVDYLQCAVDAALQENEMGTYE